MKKRITTGILIGLAAGAIDLVPMLLQKLSWDANLAALTMWIVIGFLIAIVQLPIRGILKGLLISILVLLPNLFIIGWKDPLSLIPIAVMTAILGSLSGFTFQWFINE
jgi:hypothetical protein